MKQGLDRSRPPRTAIPQYLRATTASHHAQHSQAAYRHHHHHQQQQQQQGEQRLEYGYNSPPSDGGRVVAAENGERQRAATHHQVSSPVTPYATGWCAAPPPHPCQQQPGEPSSRQAYRRGSDLTGQTGTYKQHAAQPPDRPRQLYHHKHPHHGSITFSSDAATENCGVDSNLYCLPSASTPTPSCPSSSARSCSSVSAIPVPPLHSPQDYPIRGTMSPLTSQVGGHGGGGAVRADCGGEEGETLSFIFGRPATKEAVMVGRCVSPPASLPSCKSPASADCLASRRTLSSGGAVVEREVLSPPPATSLSSACWWGEGRMLQGGVCCEQCNGCLMELKRQALRLMFPDNGTGTCLAQNVKLDGLEEGLCVPDTLLTRYCSGRCKVCETQVWQLKQEAIAMIRSIQLAQNAATTISSSSLPALVGSCTPQHRYGRKGQPYTTTSSSLPLAAQAQAYLEHNVRAWMNPKKYQMLAARATGHGGDTMATVGDLGPRTHPHLTSSLAQSRPPVPGGIYPSGGSLPSSPTAQQLPGQGPRGASPAPSSCASSPPPNSAAVSFFHRAAQKLSKKKKRQQSLEPDPPSYPTSYGQVVRLTPPPAPPCLLRPVGRLQNPGVGKVKVMLRVSAAPGSQGESTRFLSVDPHRKQITIFDPSASGYVTSANRRTGIAAPKMFAFDAVFSPDDSLTELCAASLSEIVQAVVGGADGCLFTYGYSRTGKTYSMLGTDQCALTLGVLPCAIAWLFKLINEQKDKTGARFSVRVSAVEVTGKNENLRDLLADIAQGTEATGVGTAPGVYLREDPICGTQLENQSELRAPSADKAALYLDAALAARSATDEDEARCSHLLFTLSVYQYRIEKANRAGLPGVAGGRSRLHLIDLGSASKSRDPNNVSLSLSALGNVIMALLNGQRHVPHRDSKISQLLRDSLGNVTCRTCMLAHVSSAVPHYNETLQVIQLAARIHRMKRRRTKFSSTSSEDSSTDESVKFRRPYRGLRMGTLREDVLYSSSHSDPDYTSSSEQSCDTVIYLGANGQSLSDRELTDNEGPPRHVPRTNPRLPRRPSGSRSSGDDSDSGRSRASDGRYTPRPAMGMRAGTPPSPLPVARVQPVVPVMSAPGSPNPSHVKMAHRINTHAKAVASKASTGSEVSSHWPEKVSKHRVKAMDTAGEQWVDGPGAAIYPESSKTTGEQWVDGPSAFLVQNEQQQPQQQVVPAQSPSQRCADTARRIKNRKVEAEEQWVDGPREMMASSASPTPLHTSSKAEVVGRTVVGQPNQAPKLSVAVNEKALKQALIKHLERERPDSTISVDSNVSTTAQAADSRPTSMVSSGEGAKVMDSSSRRADSRPADWDRRQAGDGVSAVNAQDSENSRAESAPPSPYRKHLGKKLQSLASPKHSPRASPASCRKVAVDSAKTSTRLQKSDLPGSASPTHRVAQWIKSVSKSDAPVSGVQTIQVTSEMPSATEVAMADAETNTEHDSDFERLADIEGSPPTQEADGGICINTADASLDSSLDSTSRGSDTRPDSLYELTVEEQLENLASRKDSSLLAKDVDDETFSSLSAREAEDTDREDSVLIQHSKVLTEGRQSAKLAKHLAARDDLDPTAFLPEVSKPLLSRKPDGASNPHLNREFSPEDGMALSEQCVTAHCATLCTDSQQYVTAQALYNKETPSPNLSAKGSKLTIRSKPPLPQKIPSSSSSPSPKVSGLNKPSLVSSSCSSSGPSAGSSATSTPKSISSKESPLLHKQISPKGCSLPVLASSPGGRKEDKKNGKNGSSNCSNSKEKNMFSSASLNTTPAIAVVKNGNNGKNGSKLPLLNSKAQATVVTSGKDSKLRKKDNGKVARSINGKNVEINPHQHKTRHDSDSGNDSGIVAHEKKLLSPYATVTKPRTPSHSSSGHGSDNSSTISTEVHSQPSSKGDKLHGGTSSGYESMLRESEGTASSSGQEDSGSENSPDRKKGSKRKGTKRSRSAPARSSESPSSNGGGSQGSRAWVDTRHAHKCKEEPLELKKYDVDDVERLQRRGQDERECRGGERSRERGKEVQTKQPQLEEGSKAEMIDCKDRISIEQRGWGFDCKFLMCFCKSRSSRATDV